MKTITVCNQTFDKDAVLVLAENMTVAGETAMETSQFDWAVQFAYAAALLLYLSEQFETH